MRYVSLVLAILTVLLVSACGSEVGPTVDAASVVDDPIIEFSTNTYVGVSSFD